MDKLTRELHSFLLALHANPNVVTQQLEHFLKHLVSIIDENQAESILHYYGVLNHSQMSLSEIAHDRHMDEDCLLEEIDNNLRRLAITPEWQELRNLALLKANSRLTHYHSDNE